MNKASPLIITGMHRSGTSLVGSMMSAMGIDLGPGLGADEHNRHGYFEDMDIQSMHRDMMAAATPTSSDGHHDWGWTEDESFDTGQLLNFIPRVRALVREREARGLPWGFKEPRASLLLDFWNAIVPKARYLIVYRPPWEVAGSMQRLRAEVFLRHPEYAYRIWTYYNKRLLRFALAHRERVVLACTVTLVRHPHLLLAACQKLRLPLGEADLASLVDQELFQTDDDQNPLATLAARTSPEAFNLLRRLDAASDIRSPWNGNLPAFPLRMVTGAPAKSPSVSIVTPCRNMGELLIEAVASVERHAPQGAEFVVVDDGSTQPRTLEVLQGLRDMGYRILSQPPRGLAAARNAGIRAGAGRNVLPLDADNRLLPGFLEQATELLDRSEAVGVVYGDWREFGLRNGPRPTIDFDLTELLLSNYIDACSVFRRSDWEAVGGYDEGLSVLEDWDLWIAFAERGVSFVRLDPAALRATFEYRVRPGSLLSTLGDDTIRTRLAHRIVSRHADLFRGQHRTLIARAALRSEPLPDLLRIVLAECALISEPA